MTESAKAAEAASDAALEDFQRSGRRPTINDIARLSGVSKKTVSRIINNSPLVRKDTREKVETLMREVGYTPVERTNATGRELWDAFRKLLKQKR